MPPEFSAPSLSRTTAPIGSAPDFLHRVSKPRGAIAAFQVFELVDPLQLLAGAVQADLKLLLQLFEETSIQRFHCLLAARGTVLGKRHALRIIEDHRNDVLLGFEGGNAESRLPEHDQQQCEQQALQDPNRGLPGDA
jgi:hypothetical protein